MGKNTRIAIAILGITCVVLFIFILILKPHEIITISSQSPQYLTGVIKP
jgi:Na+-transporting methylmalonyl-CoA/oxaloacetate decarboxylase gamma subunit